MPPRSASRERCSRSAGPGLQTPAWANVPGAHLYHILAALERTRQDFTARMIAAEALSRT